MTAKDMGDLTVERTFQVNVDGAPTDGEFSATDQTISGEETLPTEYFFSDPEMNTLMYELVDFEENPYITAEVAQSSGVLSLGVVAKTPGGPVAVTVRATEPSDGANGVGQSHDITIMVTHGS